MRVSSSPTHPLQPLAFPLRGNWFVGNGGRHEALNGHWGHRDQQFAVDLVAVGENGKTHRGDGSRPEQYYAWGRPVYAVATGTVVRAIEQLRDMPIGESDNEHIDGNHVMVAHADGAFSLYDHLQRGSVPVGVGDSIRAGQLLGRVGNSGNTSEPHLHLQLQTSDTLNPAQAESTPMVFGDIVVNEALIERGELPGRTIVRRG